MLLHRREVRADHFKTWHPKVHKKWIESGKFYTFKFPCKSIKVSPVSMWGPLRRLFMKIVAQMADGICYSRQSCVVENAIFSGSVKGSDLEDRTL